MTRTIARRALFLSLSAAVFGVAALARPATAAPVTLASGSNASRATIPVTVGSRRATCVLDTGTSAILVSPSLARRAGLAERAGTFEVAPDGRTYVDKQTEIPQFGVAGHSLRNVPALISSNLSGDSALCGYDFFVHFPTLIDRERNQVTLFPAASRLARMRCASVDLSPHVPLATVEINDTWLTHVVLDSGMAGGGALWEGVRPQLRRPLMANAEYETMPAAARAGFACGAVASVRFVAGTPPGSMPICTEPQRPDGYAGIIETNLPMVRAMAVDYPHSRICFDIASAPELASPELASPGLVPAPAHDAWARFNYLRPPARR